VRLCELFGLEDPWAENPQRPPADGYELSWRIQHAATIEREFAQLTVAEAEARLGAARVPCGEVRPLAHVFESQQARANGLVQAIYQPGVGSVELLGSVFKVDGVAPRVARPAPALNEHAGELLADDQQAAVT
jgi:crotonobetainyl-CoA:carnitine CoA-transferase CaiB-like acyl-CoA transferase